MSYKTINLGRVKPIWQGEYSNDTTYYPLDFLSHNQAIYMCVAESQGNSPENPNYFTTLVNPDIIRNRVPRWDTLSGSLERPALVFHNGDYWFLTIDLAQVGQAEPGVSPAWLRVATDTTTIIRPSIINPANETEDFFGDIESSVYQTGPRFTGDITKSVWQAATSSDFALIYAEEELTSGFYTWAPPLPSPLAALWVRVRYESNGFSSDWSPIVQVKVADYEAPEPFFLSPSAGETGWLPGSELRITDYEPNLQDPHVSTSWQIQAQSGNVVWQSLDDSINLTRIATPATIFFPDENYYVRARYFGQSFVDQAWSNLTQFTTEPHPVAVAVSPIDNATSVSPVATLEVEPFTSPLNHTTTEWRILSESSPGVFDTVAYQFGPSSTSLTSHDIPEGTLSADTQYQWQARFATEEYGTAPWSTAFTLTTMPKPDAVLAYPLEGETDVSPIAELGVEPIPSGVTHTKTEFRVYDGSNALIVTLESGSDPKTQAFDLFDLEQGTAYEWEARVVTAEYGAGPWSSRRAFVSRSLFPPREYVGQLLSNSDPFVNGFSRHNVGYAVNGNDLFILDTNGVRRVEITTGNEVSVSLPSPAASIAVDDDFLYLQTSSLQGSVSLNVFDRSTLSPVTTLDFSSYNDPGPMKSDSTHLYAVFGVSNTATLHKINKSNWAIENDVFIGTNSYSRNGLQTPSYFYFANRAYEKSSLSSQTLEAQFVVDGKARVGDRPSISSSFSQLIEYSDTDLSETVILTHPLGEIDFRSASSGDVSYVHFSTRSDSQTFNNGDYVCFDLSSAEIIPSGFSLVDDGIFHIVPTSTHVIFIFSKRVRIYKR